MQFDAICRLCHLVKLASEGQPGASDLQKSMGLKSTWIDLELILRQRIYKCSKLTRLFVCSCLLFPGTRSEARPSMCTPARGFFSATFNRWIRSENSNSEIQSLPGGVQRIRRVNSCHRAGLGPVGWLPLLPLATRDTPLHKHELWATGNGNKAVVLYTSLWVIGLTVFHTKSHNMI